MLFRKLILYIAASVDGYIAKPNDDLSFLNLVEKEGEDYGYADFIETIDTVIMGRKTYDWIKKNVPNYIHTNLDTYIITRSARENIGKINFYNGNLHDLIIELKKKPGKNIFCDGGAEIVNELLRHELIDEMVISFIPVLLGDGVRLFNQGFPEQKLNHITTRTFESGLVQVHYKFEKNVSN
jgi:dihydrofolate reductase